METDPLRCRLLADTLRTILAQGIRLSPETTRFMDATFAVARAADLAALLTDSENSEADSLLELIFYPDPPMQRQIEDLLASHPFVREDLSSVARALWDPPVYVRLIFPDGRGELVHRPSLAVLTPMVARLHIHRLVAEPILSACRRFDPGVALDIRIRLRNARTPPTKEAADFIASFLSNAACGTDEILDGLSAALELTETIGHGDIYQGLVRMRRDLTEAIDRTDRMARSWAGQNMETLMLTGRRAPHLSREAARKRIGQIDQLCLTVYGRMDHGNGPADEVDLGTITDDHDLAGLVRRLS